MSRVNELAVQFLTKEKRRFDTEGFVCRYSLYYLRHEFIRKQYPVKMGLFFYLLNSILYISILKCNIRVYGWFCYALIRLSFVDGYVVDSIISIIPKALDWCEEEI